MASGEPTGRRSALGWASRAACADADDDFFAARGRHVYRLIDRYCSRCPVTTDCLDLALSTENQSHRFGVFGGLTPDERDREARRRGLVKRTGRESALASARRKLGLVDA